MPAVAVRELYQAALAAYQKKEYAEYLRKIEAVVGVVVGDTYYYVANSFGGLLRKPNSVLADQPLAEPVILKLRIGSLDNLVIGH
jgi:hypothetical protein